MRKTLTCPISANIINENVVRIIALIISIITFITIYNLSIIGAAFLVFDFGSRAFLDGKLSPIKKLAMFINEWYHFGNQPIDSAPKIFASKLGFLFALLIFVFLVANLQTIAYIIGVLLIFCAALEAFLKVCIGCFIYTLVHGL